MYTYEVISDATNVPPMTELEAAFVQEPRNRDGGMISFVQGYNQNPTPYEPAVGRLCRVIRSQDGTTQECQGSVRQVTPNVVVSLDGAGWQ